MRNKEQRLNDRDVTSGNRNDIRHDHGTYIFFCHLLSFAEKQALKAMTSQAQVVTR